MTWIGRVIVGWYNKLFTKPTEQAKERMKICNSCEFRKKAGKFHYCSICYCEIEAKCNSPEEKCLKGKW
jgi:hypothetical protein